MATCRKCHARDARHRFGGGLEPAHERRRKRSGSGSLSRKRRRSVHFLLRTHPKRLVSILFAREEIVAVGACIASVEAAILVFRFVLALRSISLVHYDGSIAFSPSLFLSQRGGTTPSGPMEGFFSLSDRSIPSSLSLCLCLLPPRRIRMGMWVGKERERMGRPGMDPWTGSIQDGRGRECVCVRKGILFFFGWGEILLLGSNDERRIG